MIYRIRDWHKHFENSDALRYVRWTWLPLPNQHDGKYWRRLWQYKNAPEVFAAFILMLELASKMPTRGTLADDDGELSTGDMAFKTGAPQRIFDIAIPILCELKWIESAQTCADGEQTCGIDKITLPNKTIHIPQEDIDRIYHLWPTSTAKRSRVGRSLKDKDKIRRILTDGKYPLESSVVEYLKTCGDYPKDLATFLNNLPDMTPEPKKETMEQRLRRECAEAVERDANAKR